MIQTHDPDECCGKWLDLAIIFDIDSDEWECPECGMPWSARHVGPVKMWEARPAVAIWRM